MVTSLAFLTLTLAIIVPIACAMLTHACAWIVETDFEDPIILTIGDCYRWIKVQTDGARFALSLSNREISRARTFNAPIGVSLTIGYRARVYRTLILVRGLQDCARIMARAIRNARNVNGGF